MLCFVRPCASSKVRKCHSDFNSLRSRWHPQFRYLSSQTLISDDSAGVGRYEVPFQEGGRQGGSPVNISPLRQETGFIFFCFLSRFIISVTATTIKEFAKRGPQNASTTNGRGTFSFFFSSLFEVNSRCCSGVRWTFSSSPP